MFDVVLKLLDFAEEGGVGGGEAAAAAGTAGGGVAGEIRRGAGVAAKVFLVKNVDFPGENHYICTKNAGLC